MAEAGNTLDRVTQWLERAVHGPHPWWLWPSALVFLASICIGAAASTTAGGAVLAVEPPSRVVPVGKPDQQRV